jgi:hypothetical protein
MNALKRIIQKHGGKLTLIILTVGFIYYLYGVNPKYQGYAPDQPIPFSHKIHAGEVGIDCKFCHYSVERSNHASVPDLNTCMKCHSQIAGDSPDIQFLRISYEAGIPIRWNKVHDLPDHAHFSHKAHIAKGFECQTCHGPVETMDKVQVHSPFNMGWCVNCHRQYIEEEKPAGKNNAIGITTCGTCHY